VSRPSLFAHRDFRLLLAGQTTSQLGTQVSGVAIPLLAVATLHASAFEVGIINAASTIAFALIGLPAGAWLDRWRRGPVLIASDIVRAVLFATIPLAAWFGVLSIAQLVVISLLAGFARVFFDVGYQSYIPSVIGKDQVLAGNSSMEFLRASGQVAGPGLGGVLVSLIGAANVMLVQAGTFLISAVSLLAIRTREPAPHPAHPDGPTFAAQIIEGLRFVAGNRILRSTALASALTNFSFAIASAVNIIFLARDLELPAWAIGLVIAVGSVTVMAGAALTPRLSRAFGSARIIWLSLAVTVPFTLLGPLAQPGWWVVLVVISIAIGELGQIIYAITNVSLRQRLCPDRMLGRVNATMRVVIMGLFPLGAILGGVLGELVGTRLTLVAAGLVGLVAPVILFRAISHRDVEDVPSWETPQPE
jgi:MFS family permease